MRVGGSAADSRFTLLTLKRLLNTAFVLVALAVTVLVARHYAHSGWPLRRANFWLVGLAAVIFLGAYAASTPPLCWSLSR